MNDTFSQPSVCLRVTIFEEIRNIFDCPVQLVPHHREGGNCQLVVCRGRMQICDDGADVIIC